MVVLVVVAVVVLVIVVMVVPVIVVIIVAVAVVLLVCVDLSRLGNRLVHGILQRFLSHGYSPSAGTASAACSRPTRMSVVTWSSASA